MFFSLNYLIFFSLGKPVAGVDEDTGLLVSLTKERPMNKGRRPPSKKRVLNFPKNFLRIFFLIFLFIIFQVL